MTFDRPLRSVVDQAGGIRRIHEIAETLVGRDWTLEVHEATGPRPVTVLVVVRDGRPYDTVLEVSSSSSAAVRRDQARDLERAGEELRPILEAEVRRIAGTPKGAHL